MKRLLTFLLQTAIVLFGLNVLSFLLWVPLVEGRNVHATLGEIYFQDPFVAFCYAASVPFFVALYKAFQALGSVRRTGITAPDVAGSLRIIKYCAASLVCSVALGEVIILSSESDDHAGGVFMGVLFTMGALAMAALAIGCERFRRRQMEISARVGVAP